jgi:hypothetical protein
MRGWDMFEKLLEEAQIIDEGFRCFIAGSFMTLLALVAIFIRGNHKKDNVKLRSMASVRVAALLGLPGFIFQKASMLVCRTVNQLVFHIELLMIAVSNATDNFYKKK